MRLRLALVIAISLLSACASRGTTPARSGGGFQPSQVIKSDIDRVTEAHHREVFANLKTLTEKLYRRNPREFTKSGQATVDAAVARIFDVNHGWRFQHLHNTRGTRAIHLAFREDFQGDRVLAYVTGLGSMMQSAFNDKIEFFLLDDIDAQGLHNAARNVEIAIWKLSNARDKQGQLFLLSNEASGPVLNLSFEREFGKIIASLDILSKIAADKTNRTVVKVIQSAATAVFLPVR
jgi:hypothetical protein